MIDLTTILTTALSTGTLAGLGGWVLKGYQAKRTADRDDHATVVSTLVGLLSTEKAEHKVTRDHLSAALSNLELRSGQMGEFLGELKVVNDRLEEQAEQIKDLKEENETCRSENMELRRRVTKLERERDPSRVTPPNDTPAVKVEPIRPPPMHESVGGYRYGK